MKKLAVDRAHERYQRAAAALAQFKAARSYRDAEAAWTDFLIACGSFFSKLQEGAKGVDASEYWYGLKKYQRKTDPILNYLTRLGILKSTALSMSLPAELMANAISALARRKNSSFKQTIQPLSFQ